MTDLLSVEDLHLDLDGKPILRGVSCRMARGDFQLIIGPNGAGKSSLLKCILAYIRDYKGEVRIDGRIARSLGDKARARLMGYVPQILELALNMDVLSFLEMARFAYDEGVAQRNAAIAESLTLTHTEHLATRFIDELSGGERQRVLIAAALAQQPKLLVLDEPGSFLDPDHRLELVHLLGNLHREQGLTILLVTHDWNAYAPLSPKILAIKAGQVAFHCEALDLEAHLEQLFNCGFHHFEAAGISYSLPRYR